MSSAQMRQDTIADAALSVLGTAGSRGLTHRAVDTHAGLPAGSTSYYCRRRIDLLALALQRHASLDHAQLDGLATAFKARRAGWRSGEDPLRWLASALHRWMRAQDASVLAARFELFLAVSREDSLSVVFEQTRRRFEDTLADIFAVVGLGRPRQMATLVIAMVEGLLLERVRLGRLPVTSAQLRTALLALSHRSPCADPVDTGVRSGLRPLRGVGRGPTWP